MRRFSLLELIVAIAVIGLILGLVVPRLDVLPRGLRVRDTEQKINAAFYMAAAMSQSTQSEVTLQFVISEKSNRIELTRSSSEPLRSEAPEEWDEPIGGEDGMVKQASIFDDLDHYELDTKFALDEERLEEFSDNADTTYRFFPNGEAEGPDLAFLIVDVPFTLSVDRLTGRPSVIREEE